MNTASERPSCPVNPGTTLKKTKIIATFGPSIATIDQIGSLVDAGVNVFRVNCSHGAREDFSRAVRVIREGTAGTMFPVGLLFDISGPKLRLDRFKGELPVESGQRVVLTTGATELSKMTIAVNHPGIIRWVSAGERLYIDDGNLFFEIVSTEPDRVVVQAVNGGVLESGKGINLPDTKIEEPTISAKDREDLNTAVELGADFVALSFVRSADDISEARRIIKAAGGHQKVIAKLEKREAIERLEEIVALSDGVMVARGDLGVELPAEELPTLQKEITRVAGVHRKPVIVATQMLESMRFSPRATRAEVNDVATAVFDYADAVMLSAETASGRYPRESVETMARVIRSTEVAAPSPLWDIQKLGLQSEVTLAIARAIRNTHDLCPTKAIIAFTGTGFTAEMISKLLPAQPVVAVSSDLRVVRQLSLCRSVYPVRAEQPTSFAHMLRTVEELCREYGLADKKDRVVITGGAPFDGIRAANLMMIHEL